MAILLRRIEAGLPNVSGSLGSLKRRGFAGVLLIGELQHKLAAAFAYRAG